MADFKNFNELKNAFEKKAKKSLNSNVKDFIRSEIQKSILHNVYNVYEPSMYHRNFGLYNLKNYQYNISGDVDDELKLSVEHKALTSDGKDLTKLILFGQEGAKKYGSDVAQYNEDWIIYTKWRYKKYGKPSNEIPFYEPRNFMATAKQVLSFDKNRKKLISEFQKGMK